MPKMEFPKQNNSNNILTDILSFSSFNSPYFSIFHITLLNVGLNNIYFNILIIKINIHDL